MSRKIWIKKAKGEGLKVKGKKKITIEKTAGEGIIYTPKNARSFPFYELMTRSSRLSPLALRP